MNRPTGRHVYVTLVFVFFHPLLLFSSVLALDHSYRCAHDAFKMQLFLLLCNMYGDKVVTKQYISIHIMMTVVRVRQYCSPFCLARKLM